MNRRIAIILLTILVAGVCFLGYFIQQGRRSLLTDPYRMVARNACIVIETIDISSFFNSMTTGKGLFAEMGNVNELRRFSNRLKLIADQMNKSGIKRFTDEGKALISFHPATGGGLVPFLSMTTPPGIGHRQIKDGLSDSGVSKMAEYKIEGKKLLEIPYIFEGKIDTLFIGLSSGLLVCSPSREMIMQSLVSASQENDIRSAPGFSKILLSSGKNEDKVFVIFGNLAQVISPLFGREKTGIPESISKLGDCAGGDIFISDEGISASGYTESSDPETILNDYRTIEPGELKTYRVLPAATVLFESTLFLKPGMTNTGPGRPSAEIASLAADIMPFLGREITKAYIDIRNRPVQENSLQIYELANRVRCEQIFMEKLGRNSEVTWFEPDDQTRVPIYVTGKPGLLETVLPGFGPDSDDSYYTFYDNYMVTGNSYVTIARFLYDNMLSKTLANDPFYRDFERTMPSRAGYLFYCVPSRVIDYLAGYFSSDLVNGFRSNRISLNKIQSVGFQLSSINGMIYNSLSVSYKDAVREESFTEWETLLDSVACIKPFFFTNHNTGAKEIFIQDVRNNAYLINAAGRVLWKVPLSERITGPIYMIDYYRNGKYQLLFAGRNEIHILDRNGNYVERYPVKLRSPATNSLALFDYDNNLNYRLVIAGEDKQVYAYDKTGSVIRGWKPFRTAGVVRDVASFYRISGKDYIVVADESSIYFLDRYGNIRLHPDDAVTKAAGSTLRLNPGTEPFLVCTSPDGTVNNIHFDGKVRKRSLNKFGSDHQFDFFDVDGDSFGEYIFIEKGIIYLYDNDGTELFTRDFGSGELGGPINFIFSSSVRKIGVFDMERDLIYLISSNGDIMNGFPLRGASMFSIGKISGAGEWNLIVGGTDRFLYNYKLDTTTQ